MIVVKTWPRIGHKFNMSFFLPGTPHDCDIDACSDLPELVVVTGDGAGIKILELQPAGKKRMTAEEFLRGYPVQDGYRFGPERLA